MTNHKTKEIAHGSRVTNASKKRLALLRKAYAEEAKNDNQIQIDDICCNQNINTIKDSYHDVFISFLIFM